MRSPLQGSTCRSPCGAPAEPTTPRLRREAQLWRRLFTPSVGRAAGLVQVWQSCKVPARAIGSFRAVAPTGGPLVGAVSGPLRANAPYLPFEGQAYSREDKQQSFGLPRLSCLRTPGTKVALSRHSGRTSTSLRRTTLERRHASGQAPCSRRCLRECGLLTTIHRWIRERFSGLREGRPDLHVVVQDTSK